MSSRRNLKSVSILSRHEHSWHQLPVSVDLGNMPETVGADIISVSDLTDKLFADAYEAILDAIIHHDSGLVD